MRKSPKKAGAGYSNINVIAVKWCLHLARPYSPVRAGKGIDSGAVTGGLGQAIEWSLLCFITSTSRLASGNGVGS
jgi:hypothetical protein